MKHFRSAITELYLKIKKVVKLINVLKAQAIILILSFFVKERSEGA
jgi:hypothetical protein